MSEHDAASRALCCACEVDNLSDRLAVVELERDGLAARLAAVEALANGWVGFDDSHHYGDAVLHALYPAALAADPADTTR